MSPSSRHLTRALLFGASLALATVGALPTTSLAETRVRVTTTAGERSNVRVAQGASETLRTDRAFADVVVADPDIADVVPLTDRSAYVVGKKRGRTSVSLYDGERRLIGVIQVEVSSDQRQLAAELRRMVPGGRVQVGSANGRILLSGSVPDGAAAERAIAIARQFDPEAISNISVARSQQVMLEVRFIEARRGDGRELAVQWEVLANRLAVTTGAVGLATGNAPFGALIGRLLDNGVQADVIVRALEERGVARRLAEPNLVALSGQTANFLAGGEFPIPIQSTQGQTNIEFKRFGVGLAFTPTVLADGLINLKIEPEVSEIDPTASIRLGTLQIPGLSVRRASTTIELRDGQSFAIAGLLQAQTSTTMSQLPWLSDIPILGALFRSASFQRRETDLVIIVTPRLVRPAAPGVALRTPLDGARRGNDADVFLLGRAERAVAGLRQEARREAPVRRTGHIIELSPGGSRAQTR